MPNGGEHYERLGACPLCGSPRIRIRRQRHRRLLWRCRSCNRVFGTPKVAEFIIPPGDDGSGYVLAESIPQMERRGRLPGQQGGQHGRRRSGTRILVAVIFLVIVLGAAGLFVYLAGVGRGGDGSAQVPESDESPVVAALQSPTPMATPLATHTPLPSSPATAETARASIDAAVPTDTPPAKPTVSPSHTPEASPTATISPTPSPQTTPRAAQAGIATAVPTDAPLATSTTPPSKTPTPTPRPTATPQISPTPMSATPLATALVTFENGEWLMDNRPSLAAAIVAIDWIHDGIGASESEVVQEVVTLAAFHELLTSSLISRPWFGDGITGTELDGIKYLGYIAYDSDAIAGQVADMPWFADGITKTEVGAIDNLAYIAQSSQAVAEQIADILWFADDITDTELEGLEYFRYLAYDSEAAAKQVADMPWFTDGITETEVGTIEYLSYIAQSSEAVAKLVVDIPWFADGIIETELGVIDNLAYIAQSSGAVAKQVAEMPWFADGITKTEIEGVKNLSYMVYEGEAAARQVAGMPWFADGITETEVRAIDNLSYVAQNNAAAAERIARMPFLTAIEPADVSAMESLAYMADLREDAFERVMTHPLIAGGITDDIAPIVATLDGVAETNPALIDTLLDPDSVNLERRSMKLPLAGDVDLVIIRTRPGAAHIMDLLDYAVRSAEDLMGLPLPTRYVGLLFEDAVSVNAAGTNFGTHIAFLPEYDAADTTPAGIAHEVAHYYWSGNAAWVDEGIASFMGSAIENMWAREWVDLVAAHCSYAQTIAELETLTHVEDLDSDEFGCNYSLGERLFVDMYHAVGEESFWQGLRELYIESLVDDGELKGTDVNIAHLREAFQSHPGASTAIARWYDGTESYDLTQLDSDPADPSLPSIKGRIDEAFIQIGENGPKVSSFSAQDVGEHVVWLNLDYSYNVTGGPHNVLLSFEEFYEDGFQFGRGTVEVTAEDQYTGGTTYIPVGSEHWAPGRYWVYIYEGDRKVAEVQYEVTP